MTKKYVVTEGLYYEPSDDVIGVFEDLETAEKSIREYFLAIEGSLNLFKIFECEAGVIGKGDVWEIYNNDGVLGELKKVF